MLSQRLLTATCVLALFATPALPQSTPGVLRTSANQSVLASNPPANMRAALRAWGLDRQTQVSRFTKGTVTNDRAEFSVLSYANAKGERSTLENLVIMRDPTPGPNLGTFTIQGTKFLEQDGSTLGSFTLSGVRGGANLLQSLANTDIVKPADGVQLRRTQPSAIFADSVSFNDVILNLTDKDGLTVVRTAKIEFAKILFGPETLDFDTMEMNNSDFDSKSMRITIATIRMNGFTPDALPQLSSTNPSVPFDIMGFKLGGLVFEDMTYTFKSLNSQPSPINTASIARLGVDNVKDGFIGKFLLAGLKLRGGTGASAWESSLAQLGLSEINMRFFSEMGSAMAKLVPNQTGSTPLAPPRSLTAPILLKDLLKAGPLDNGVRGINLTDFRVDVAGFDFLIDQIGLTQQRNSDDVAIASEIIPTTMRLTWPEIGADSTNPVAKLVKAIDIDSMAVRFSGRAIYEPSTDVVGVSNYQVELVDWGKVQMDFEVTGIAKLYAQTTAADMITIGLEAQPKAGADPKATSKTQLDAMFGLYKDVGIKSGRIELFDLGGLDKGTRLFMSTSRQNNPSPTVSAQDVRAQRDSWAQTARGEAGKKNSTLFLRQIAVSGARWIENGGSIVAQISPTTPVTGSEFLTDTGPPVERWGLRFFNTAPPRLPPTQPPASRR